MREAERVDVEAVLQRVEARDGVEVGQLIRSLSIHGNKLKSVLECLTTICRRHGMAAREILESAPIAAILSHPTLSPLDRYKRLSAQLKQWQDSGDANWAPPPLLMDRSSEVRNRAPVPTTLLPNQLYVDRGVLALPTTQAILARFPQIPYDITDDIDALTRALSLTQGKKTWFLTRHKGQSLKRCPAWDAQYYCCNYWTFDLLSHCPFECSYCVLQSYLKNKPAIHIYMNVDEILASLGERFDAMPQKKFRVGTGELADSLALDPLLKLNQQVIEFFAAKSNAVLELKTKSAYVDHLLDIDHRGKTVFAWSVNPPEVIASEEFKTASLDARLNAAKKVVAAHYPVAFHLDPIIIDPWDEAASIARYEQLIDTILDQIPASSIAWVSFGTLRFTRELKAIAEDRMPKTRIYSAAFERDGLKFHYKPEVRIRIFERLWKRWTSAVPKERLYLCMEGKSTWQAVDPSCTGNDMVEGRLLAPFMF